MDLTPYYTNAARASETAALFERWTDAAADFRERMDRAGRAQLDLAYEATERQALDLFRPEGTAAGLAVFVHGGYWRRYSRREFSHLANGLLDAGWAVALPSYRLAPRVRVSDIADDVAAAVAMAAGLVPQGPIRLTGHSAGGQLVARMVMADGGLGSEVLGRITRVASISPVCDLRPLMQTNINDDLHLDPDEAARESPVLHRPVSGISGSVWVGARELQAFRDQARDFAVAWDWPLHELSEQDHYTMVAALEDPRSALVRDIVG